MPVTKTAARLAGLLVVATLGVTGAGIVTQPAPQAAAAPVIYTGAGSASHIGLIGDSAWAGIRWTNSFGPLRRFNFTADLESCRRTIGASCRGREGYAPSTTVGAMRLSAGRWGAVLVIATGYNDPGATFANAVDQVMNEASSQQIYRVVWMTMRTADVTYVSPGFTSNTFTFRDNNRILLQKAAQYGGRLQIADWASYSASHPEWFTSDGIHLRPNGAVAAAGFIADSAGAALGGATLTPANPNAPATDWVNVGPGDAGTRVVIVQQFLARAGIGIFGGADGRYGAYTADAVREFQARVGLAQSGVVDKATAIRLGLWYNDGSAPTTPPTGDWVNVSPGDTGMRVAIVHNYLRRAGVAVNGDADGRYGSVTTAAVQAFQAQSGLPATGVVDRATAIRLGLWPGGSPPTAPPVGDWVNVSPGDSGMRVAIVHDYLRRAGVAVNGDANGLYGAVTTAAVRTFQTRVGLPATGVVDRATAIELGLWYRPATLAATTMAASVAPPVSPTLTAIAASEWIDLTIGSHGDAVAEAQRLLMNAGVFLRGGADGQFGEDMRNAVLEYQKLQGLPETGVVDVATAAALGMVEATADLPTTSAEPPPDSAPEVPEESLPDDGGVTESTPPTSDVAEPETSEPADSSTSLVGDFVWLDQNADGQQNDVERGFAGVTVRLLSADLAPLAETVTSPDGQYEFAGLDAATYVVEFVVPDGHEPTAVDRGTDDALDSDIDILDMLEIADTDEVVIRTLVSVDGAAKDVDLDAGLVVAPASDAESPATTEELDLPETTTVETTTAPDTTAVEPVVTLAPETSVPATDSSSPATQPEPPVSEAITTTIAP